MRKQNKEIPKYKYLSILFRSLGIFSSPQNQNACLVYHCLTCGVLCCGPNFVSCKFMEHIFAIGREVFFAIYKVL